MYHWLVTGCTTLHPTRTVSTPTTGFTRLLSSFEDSSVSVCRPVCISVHTVQCVLTVQYPLSVHPPINCHCVAVSLYICPLLRLSRNHETRVRGCETACTECTSSQPCLGVDLSSMVLPEKGPAVNRKVASRGNAEADTVLYALLCLVRAHCLNPIRDTLYK